MELLLIIVALAAILALSYATFSYFKIKKLEEGTDRMKEISSAIRTGSNAFISYEYKVITIIAVIVAVILFVLISWQTAVAFILGAIMSALAGFIGMKVATYANVRVANKAKETNSIGETVKVAFRGGSVMGLCVGGFALLGILIVYLVFGLGLGQINATIGGTTKEGILLAKVLGLAPTFTNTLSGYALGCSFIAMFARVGGGIYTKAADMGADLVGKTEAHLPEDDPRNPATIADNVGDNVGDVAGLGSDLLESYIGALTSCIILAFEFFRNQVVASELLARYMIYFPMAFAGCGIIACVLGVLTMLIKKKPSNNPHRELNFSTYISAGLALLSAIVLSCLMFRRVDKTELAQSGCFNLGIVSPAICAILGILAGILIGIIAEYYTSYDYKPTKNISYASKEGPALTITQGLALGMKSCMAPVCLLGVAIYGSYLIGDMYGVAVAALGMLSFVSATVSVDTYGPISDNAGGIAEMSGLDSNVREITDKLDSVGNTTAAIGKGFAIGSAALAVLSMLTSYMYSFSVVGVDLTLDILANPLILIGVLVGAGLPYLFSGMLIEAVAKAARKMVDEVRRQFREIKGLLAGQVLPDYKTCIEISTQGSIKEMRVPAIISIAIPVVFGFIFGAEFVAGILLGSTISAIMLAIFTGNAGGAWDNAKKYVETGAIEGQGKGSEAHDAAIVGDTVGDPLKDTVGPSLDIFIKIMSTVSLVFVVVFDKYNLFSLLK